MLISVITLILVIFSFIMIYTIYKKSQIVKEDGAQVKLNYSPDELRLENVGPGGVIHITGVGEELDDFDVNILSRHIYREGDLTWYELEGESGDGKVWIELEEDDELEISIKLKELKFKDIGIKKDDLERIDDTEEGEISYLGEKFYYEDSDEAIFYRHGVEENAEKFYYWDFENEGGSKYIAVEKWGSKYDISFSVPLKTSQITVYSLKK